MTDRHQQKPYPLRMPDELRERLDEAATKNGRSLNAEIVRRLEQSFERSSSTAVLSFGDICEWVERSRTTLEFMERLLSEASSQDERERRSRLVAVARADAEFAMRELDNFPLERLADQ